MHAMISPAVVTRKFQKKLSTYKKK